MSDKKIDKESMASFIEAFSKQIDNDNIELFKNIIKDTPVKVIEDYEDFFYSYVYPYEEFLEGFIRTMISKNNDVVFIHLNSQFIEAHFQKIIVSIEGSTCCADKSRTILKSLIRFFNGDMGEDKIEWDYNQKYTFHLPKIVFITHDEIMEFYLAVKDLYYGNFTKYLNIIMKIAKIQQKTGE